MSGRKTWMKGELEKGEKKGREGEGKEKGKEGE